MRTFRRTILLLLVLPCTWMVAQENLAFDQQSSINESAPLWNQGPIIQYIWPAQSFTPELDSIDFIRLKTGDYWRGDGAGATLWVNLRAGSVDGAVLSSTDPVVLPDSFLGVVNFTFPTTVSLTPATTYYLEPQISAGSSLWNIDVSEYDYPGGICFRNGEPSPGGDFWFREGIGMIPEPSSLALLALGLGGFAVHRKMRSSKRKRSGRG